MMYRKKYSHNNFIAELVQKRKKYSCFKHKNMSMMQPTDKKSKRIFHELEVKLILKRFEGAMQ